MYPGLLELHIFAQTTGSGAGCPWGFAVNIST